MALQSQLFRGDSKLEAAAVSDPAHILIGASGPHVRKIQFALFLLDGATIAQDGIYGPRTAAAVSAFKQKRQILNAQGRIDDIVGKKTIAALDAEMLAKERGSTPPLPPPPKPTPKPPVPKPPTPIPPSPIPPPVVLEFGSTNWRFSFFGNKGFTGKGIYSLFIASADGQDSKNFLIEELSSSGDLLAGFKGECRGTFTTAKKILVNRFQAASCDFLLGKILGSDILNGSMSLGLVGPDFLGAFLPLVGIRDETFGTSITTGIIKVHGQVRQR